MQPAPLLRADEQAKHNHLLQMQMEAIPGCGGPIINPALRLCCVLYIYILSRGPFARGKRPGRWNSARVTHPSANYFIAREGNARGASQTRHGILRKGDISLRKLFHRKGGSRLWCQPDSSWDLAEAGQRQQQRSYYRTQRSLTGRSQPQQLRRSRTAIKSRLRVAWHTATECVCSTFNSN